MLASPESVLSQPQRKTSQPVIAMDDSQNSGLRNSHISPGGLVNSNPSSNDILDEVGESLSAPFSLIVLSGAPLWQIDGFAAANCHVCHWFVLQSALMNFVDL